MNKSKRIQIQANPHNCPKTGYSQLNEWAIIVVDMQNDYCSKDCYMDKAGFDINKLRKPIKPIQKLLNEARTIGIEVIYTRHGEPEVNKDEIGASSKGDYGWEIVADLKPLPEETIFDKSTTSAFMSSSIDSYLKKKGYKYLAFCGNTIDCCVHSTLRSANDLGYNCLLLKDCCGAVSDNLYKWSIESITVENGVFGAVTDSITFINSLKKL